MLLLVVPAVVQTYHNFQAPLPAATKLVLVCSCMVSTVLAGCFAGIVVKYTGSILAVLSDGVVTFRQSGTLESFAKSSCGRQSLSAILVCAVIQALGLLLSGGMLLVDCLYAIQNIHKRSLFVDDLQQLADEVAAGVPFWQAMERCSLFPAAARQVLVVSEQTGRLALAVAQLSQYYEQQLQQRLQMAGKLLEPCFIVLLGGMVLVLAGSLFLPLVQSYQYLL